MRHLVILGLVLSGAVASYRAGFGLGIGFFIGLGVALELAFWIMAIGGNKAK